MPQAEASPGELVGLQLVAAPQIDTESSPQVLPRSCGITRMYYDIDIPRCRIPCLVQKDESAYDQEDMGCDRSCGGPWLPSTIEVWMTTLPFRLQMFLGVRFDPATLGRGGPRFLADWTLDHGPLNAAFG